MEAKMIFLWIKGHQVAKVQEITWRVFQCRISEARINQSPAELHKD